LSQRIGEILLKNKLISKDQLNLALAFQQKHNCKLGQSLVAIKAIPNEETIMKFVAQQLNMGSLDLTDLDIDENTSNLIPSDMAIKFNVIPINKIENVLTVAIADPNNLHVLDAIKFISGCTINPLLASESAIRKAIDKYYDTGDTVGQILDNISVEDFELITDEAPEEENIDELKETLDNAPLVKLVNRLISDGVMKGASDIHIETYEKIVRVRFRIDGNLIEMTPLPYRLRTAIISRIKIMASLNISERRLPQDGRIKLKIGNRPIDIRVSCLPTIFGEKVVLRLLDPSNLMLDLDKFGFFPEALKSFKDALNSPHGIILVTGPTGSGKTTTLYSALTTINKADLNIITSEDPVEYNMEGINQVQVNADIGLTFASALRSFLRQDPDVILVGEIRDRETAEIAIRASLTGHLVLSTLHTNDSANTVTRLIDMGIEPFLLAASLRLIIAQRLLRKICEHCKEPIKEKPAEVAKLLNLSEKELNKVLLYGGHGCTQCNQSGYQGRAGIYEVMPITPAVKECIIQKAPPNVIEGMATKEGMQTLRQVAIEKLKKGITTYQEVIRSTEE